MIVNLVPTSILNWLEQAFGERDKAVVLVLPMSSLSRHPTSSSWRNPHESS